MITLCKNISHELINEKIKKNFPHHDITRLYDIVSTIDRVQQELLSENIFQIPRVIILARIDADFWNTIIDSLEHLPKTTQVFWVEENFPAAIIKKIPNHVLWEEKTVKEIKQNPFSIANTLLSGDTKVLWVTYHQLLTEGNDPEVIFGILWWKLKDIIKKKKTVSHELKQTTHRFLETYTNARKYGNLEMQLEQLLLSINKKDLA